ncbi:MAG: glycosyltransferase [Bacteriovoracaceae bacterium]
MKVVITHDWLVGFRGGERVLEAIVELFPNAPIYTLIHKPGTTSKIIESHEIVTSKLNKFPNIFENYRKTLPIMPMIASNMKITHEADLVISSSHCVIKGVPKPKNSVHISYVHSPMRYIYDQFDAYFGKGVAPLYQRKLMQLIRPYLQNWDKKSNSNVDHFIANADFVRKRINDYYNRDATVINPFVDIEEFKKYKIDETKKDYFVVLSAFAPNKRVDLAVKAFNKLGIKLKIIGSGQQEAMLKAMSKPNIEFLGNIPRADVIEILSGARALIFPGIEDFGITPLEALLVGTPVIAYSAGGVLETLNNKVADFFYELNEDALISAIEQFQDSRFKRADLISRAHDFSKEKFQKKLLDFIAQKTK